MDGNMATASGGVDEPFQPVSTTALIMQMQMNNPAD